MKEKEFEFMKTLINICEHTPFVSGMATDYSSDKQLMYYLDKWSDKGWWDYGVSLRTGWFTPEGIEYFYLLENSK